MGGLQQNEVLPEHGSRTLNSTLDAIVRNTPDKTYSLVPKTGNIKDGFKPMSFADLSKGVAVAAHWLDRLLGKLPQEPSARQTIAYLGPNDIRIHFLILAADRTNRSLLIPLPYNSPEALVEIINVSKTHDLLAPHTHTHAWEKVKAQRPELTVNAVPDLDYFTQPQEAVVDYPYEQDIASFWDCAPFTIQTSGTTGHPKPLLQTNAQLSSVDACLEPAMRNAPISEQYGQLLGVKNTVGPNCLPLTWMAGIALGLILPLWCNHVPVVLPASIPLPPTAEILRQVQEQVPSIDYALVTPNIVRQLYDSPGGPELLASIKTITYCGAPMPDDLGDAVAKLTRLQCLIGSTDLGLYEYFANEDGADWAWLDLDLSGPWKLEHFSDDLYELVLEKQPHRLRAGFLLYPDRAVYRTADLWRQHPDPAKPHLWRTAGRADDFVKLASMTKFNAIDIEAAVNAHPAVARCVVGGDSRNGTFVILQPAEPESFATPDEALRAMWPAMERANVDIAPEARLSKRLAIVATPEKPLGVTQKGTTERRKALTAYAAEIEELYASG